MEDQKKEEAIEEKSSCFESKKVKNLVSTIILLTGLLIGSLFVDVTQLIKGGGFSKKNLNKTDVFEVDGKTWVAYQEPGVTLKVVSDDNCAECDPTEALVWLRRVMPTVSAEKIDFNSDEGKDLQEKFNLKSLPAFIFDDNVIKTDFYLQAQMLFRETEDGYFFNVQELGITPGKFLTTPTVSENDASLGNKEAETKVIVFSDFECPYSKMLHTPLRTVAKNYQDKIEVVFKNLPLSFHKQSNNAALAGECAKEQNKFWEYADRLFSRQNEWSVQEGTNIFKSYAGNIGLNYNQFAQCLDTAKYQDKINADQAEAQDFGISATPAVFVGDQFQNGAMNETQLKSLVEKELNK